MFSASLFFGFEMTPELQDALSRVNPALLSMFVDSSSEYLQECQFRNLRYLGKEIESPLDLGSMEAIGTHVESLVKRLIPDFSSKKHPLLLIARASCGQ